MLLQRENRHSHPSQCPSWSTDISLNLCLVPGASGQAQEDTPRQASEGLTLALKSSVVDSGSPQSLQVPARVGCLIELLPDLRDWVITQFQGLWLLLTSWPMGCMSQVVTVGLPGNITCVRQPYPVLCGFSDKGGAAAESASTWTLFFPQ